MNDRATSWVAELEQATADIGSTIATEVLNAVAVPAWLHAPQQPLQFNAALARLCGITPDDLNRVEHLEQVVPEDREALAAATNDCLHGSGEPPALSMQLLTRNGTQRPVELTLRRIRLADQAAVMVTCADLSDIQHAQSMMLSMGSLLRQIVEGAPVAVYVLDHDGCITHWNGACERLTGHSADDMLGSSEHWRAFFKEPRTLLADLIVSGADPLAAGTDLGGSVHASNLVAGAFVQELHFADPQAPDGRWLHFTVAALRDQGGQTSGAIVTLQDVSERRRTEGELTRRIDAMVNERSAELAAHARLMDAFIDNAPIGVAYTINDQVQRVNRRMHQIFGIEHSNEGEDAAVFLAPDDARRLRKLASPLFALNEPLDHELWLQHRSGRSLWVQVNACPVEYSDDSTGAWWMVQDRTEVRQAQETLHQRFEELQATNQKLEQAQNQLLQQDKMASIGQLAAGVAHEINNPVGFVSSNLHTLRQYIESLLQLVDAQARACAAPADAAVQAELKRVQQEVELDYLKEDLPQLLDESADGLVRVKKIVQDLKDFSRVDQSDWQEADLNAGLESTLNVVRNEVKYKCEVVMKLGAVPLVKCLAGQLNQVFMNLIVNASHAIVEQGTITLSSGTVGGWAWMQVDDTGRGMTEDVRRRVFEPFFTTKEVGKGTGLGLSLSFSIIKRHQGHIEVRSTPGVGSSFRVCVPVAGPGSMQGDGDAPAAPPPWI